MTNKNAFINALIIVCLSSTCYAETPSPVTTISAEELARSGHTDVAELLQSLPVLPSITTTRTPGTASINLRGLGTSRTLVLVNGSRVSPPAGGDSLLNQVPVDMIERVEIVTDGAAAHYGSDAIAGVLNFVMSDEYDSVDPQGSYYLDALQSGLGGYQFTAESKEECDATHGSLQHFWTMNRKFNYGLQDFSLDGKFMTWGSVDNGYKRGTIPGSPGLYPLDDYVYTDKLVERGLPASFVQIEKVRDQIMGLTDTPEQDRRAYVAMLGLTGAWPGKNSLSDFNYALGRWTPEGVIEEFREYSTNRTDEDRQAFTERYDFLDATPADSPPPTDAPAADPPAAPEYPDPFADDSSPPLGAFDLSACKTQEQKDKIIRLVRERQDASGDWAYYADYMRGYPYTARSREDRLEDEKNAAAAIVRRDKANDELRKTWLECVNPTTATQTASSAEPESSATTPEADDKPLGFGVSVKYQFTRHWNAEFHAWQEAPDGSKSKVPAAGLGVGVYPNNYGFYFGLPLSPDAFRDIDLDAGAGAGRDFTDDQGRAFIPGAFSGFGFGQLQEGDYEVTPGDDGDSGFIPQLDLGYKRQFQNDDWQLFADLDWKHERRGPTLGFKYTHQPKDRVFQQFYWSNPANGSVEEQRQQSWDATPQYFRDNWSGDLNFGSFNYRTYTFAENGDYDLGGLDAITGQTSWGNDQCGDTAFPPEGQGYLTAAQSPVKSVSDQWAFTQVGLEGDEPTLDEFAKPVVVAVVDTGVDWNHLDFSWDKLWKNDDEIPGNLVDDDGNGYIDDLIGWNFTGQNNLPWDHDGHGTFVAGVIAATQGNDAGIDGINGSAKIMVLKAVNNFGRTRASFVAEAIVYAADNGAQLVNLSVTGPGFPQIVQDAVDYAASKNVLVIMAAGNRAEDISLAEPALLRGVLTVAATGPDDKRARFSNVGSAVDIAAPGIDVVSLRARATDFMFDSAETSYVPGDAFLGDDKRYYRSTGTSFATPIVTGVASLLLSNNPGLSPAQLKRVLEQSARDVEIPGRDRFTGYGVVDAKAALAADPNFFIDAEIPWVRPLEVDGQRFMQVAGVANAEQFASATLEIGEGDDPQSWSPVGNPVVTPVEGGELGRVPVGQLSGSPAWTIRLTVQHQNGRKREARYVVEVVE